MEITTESARVTPDTDRYISAEDSVVSATRLAIIVTPNAFVELAGDLRVTLAIEKALDSARTHGVKPYTGPVRSLSDIVRIARYSNTAIPQDGLSTSAKTPDWVKACEVYKMGFSDAPIVFLQYAQAGNLMISFHDEAGALVSAPLEIEQDKAPGLPPIKKARLR